MSEVKKSRGQGAAECLRFDERPTTPRSIRKYRKTYFEEPGSRVTHHGLIDDSEKLREQLSNTRLGSQSNRADVHVNDLFNSGYTGTLSDYVEARKESIYKTVQREPLGKPYVRGHTFDQLREEKPHLNNNEAAKNLIYSGESKNQDRELDEKVRRQYILSHNSFEPGEQRNRNYNWHSLDPNTHRFGGIESKREEGVGYCLQPDKFSPSPTITNSAVAKHRLVTEDRLGQPKYRGNLDPETVQRLEERVEMKKRSNAVSFSARDCIEGDYSYQEQMPDDNLGKATRPGWRNMQTTRVFGTPTVRTDIPAPKTRSVSDSQNYGDDTTAGKLLFPPKLLAQGLEEGDFLAPRDKNELIYFARKIGNEFSEEEFDIIYSQACFDITGAYTDSGCDIVNLEIFLSLIKERQCCHDEGFEPSWWPK